MKKKFRAFRVICDVNNYQYFLWDIPRDPPGGPHHSAATFASLRCDGRRMADRWKPPPVFIYKPRHKRGDFWAVGMGGGGLGIAPWALKTLRMLAEMGGELLPLPYKDQSFTLRNINECIECVDPERSEWEMYKMERSRIHTPFFRADRMSASTLFKSAHSDSEIYCLDYSGDPEEEFKACVEHHKLKGLLFEEVMIG
jgi:hypothetical protein